MRIMPQVYTRTEVKRKIISGSTPQFCFHVEIHYAQKQVAYLVAAGDVVVRLAVLTALRIGSPYTDLFIADTNRLTKSSFMHLITSFRSMF